MRKTRAFKYLKQFDGLVRFKKIFWKGPLTFAHARKRTHESWRRMLLSRHCPEEIKKMEAELGEKNYPDGSIVTVTFGSRRLGNPDNNIDLFLSSFLEFTHRPERIEILVKIDEGDDLPFFLKMKRKYGKKINLRFLVSARGRGYEDMHIWHHDLVKQRNPAARLHYILTDDAVFIYKNWDDEIVKILERRKDTYFIGTACTLELAITYFGPNPVKPVPVYWIRGDDYPIYGFDLLTSAAKVTKNFPQWNEFGNLQLVDQYAGALLETAWKKFGENLHEEIALYAERRGANFSWSEDDRRGEIRTRTLNQFHNQESKDKREKIVAQILADMKSKSGPVSG